MITYEGSQLRSTGAQSNGFEPRAGFRPFDPIDAEATLGARFREVAHRRGAATALVDGETRVSYAELLQRSEGIARALHSRWGQAGGVVGICDPSARETIQTMLGTLLGGFAYFCIDPSLPKPQAAKLIEAAGVIAMAGNAAEPGCDNARAPTIKTCGPSGIAALYATSGSTGEPKLVALSHRAVLFDIGRQSNDLYLGPDDRIDSLFSLAFSASLATVFGALLNGAELHLQHPSRLGGKIVPWLEESRITVSTMTVSMLRHACLAARTRPACPGLRLLSVGGEPLLAKDVDAFRAVFAPSCVLQNAMAATETRTYAQYFVPRSGLVADPVPIGWPVAGKEVILLDEHGAPVPEGAVGEIAVRSHYLADGYSNDPQNTAAKFQTQPDGTVLYRTGDQGSFQADGSLIFLGRKDSLVKIRGHRVELHAVVNAIHLHPAIQTSVAGTCEDSAGNARLVAYVVMRPNASVAEDALRAFLREHLPVYAIPSTFAFVRELPLNANGKVDFRGLFASPGAGRSQGSTMEILCDIWEEVLERPGFSPDDTFFDLGGDSLSAVRVLVAIHERLRCDLPADSLQRFATLKDLAAFVNRVEKDGRPASMTVFHEGGRGWPFIFVPGIDGAASGFAHIADKIAPDHPSYGLSVRLDPAVNVGMSIESIARDCVAEVQRMVPHGRLVLVGYSFGGIVAFEIARQLQRGAVHDPLLVVIDIPMKNGPGVRAPRFWEQALDLAGNIPAWAAHEAAHLQPRQLIARAQSRLAGIGRWLLGRPAAREFDPQLYFGTASVPPAYLAFLTRRYEAMRNYQPEPYAGKVIVLRAKAPSLFRSRDPRMGWQTVAKGGVEVRTVPGNHDDCVSVLHGVALARELMRCVLE